MAAMHLSTFVFMSILTGHALENGLFLRNDCSCPGYNLTFECTVNGSIGDSTVWTGEVFTNSCMMPHLFLRHRYFMQGISQACNNDDVMLRAYSLQVETIDSGNDYSSYTSQLNITYSTSVIGSTVVCAYDNGTQIIHIGSEIITTNIKFYPPPTGIHLTSVDQFHFITFSWNPITPECSAFHYRIFATNCGICPSTTVHNTVTCVLDHVSSTITLCSFAVQSMFCGDSTTGNISEPIQMMFKVLEPPLIASVQPRYSYLTGDSIGFLVEFTNLPSFSLSDEIDGSALSYTLIYNNSVSGDGCGSAIVPASSCIDRVCWHSFTYEESDCSSLSTDINITISATNILGTGPSSEPTLVHSSRNTLFNVTFSLSSNSIICTFFNQQTFAKFCQIEYGSKQESCNSFLVSKNTIGSNFVSIDLPSHFFLNGSYCFKVKGFDGRHTAFVEGTMSYSSGNHPGPDCDLPMAIIILIIVMSLISCGSIIIVIVQILLMTVRAKRRSQNPPSTCVNNAIYEEPDHNIIINTHQTIAISDNIAYHSVMKEK